MRFDIHRHEAKEVEKHEVAYETREGRREKRRQEVQDQTAAVEAWECQLDAHDQYFNLAILS